MISIILGTFNRINKLKASIESIQKCTIHLTQQPQIIVIDGGSTDGSLEYLDSISNVELIEEGGLHGVTRAYNRGFRLANRHFVTWSSDDFVYDPLCLKNAINRLHKEDNKTLISFSIDVKDGKGFVNYGENTPVGAGRRSVFELVDYWSEDFITYASDNDFSMKIHMAGGSVKPEPGCKVIHNIDLNDNLHKENLKNNPCSTRYRNIYKNGISFAKKDKCTYPKIYVQASSIQELITKVEKARKNNSWCNFYTSQDFGHQSLLNSMNIQVESFTNNKNYNLIL